MSVFMANDDVLPNRLNSLHYEHIIRVYCAKVLFAKGGFDEVHHTLSR